MTQGAPTVLADHDELRALLNPFTRRTSREYLRLAELSVGASARDGEWTSSDEAELQALLAEYASLREESLNTVVNRIQVLMLGFAAIGAVTGTVLASGSTNPLVVTAAFSWGVPVVCVFVFLVWLSEAVRSHRVGLFLAADVEARINAKIGRLVLAWEAALWTGLLPRDEWGGPSMAALLLVLAIGAVSPYLGTRLSNIEIGLTGRPLLYELWLPYALLGAAAVYGWSCLPRLQNTGEVASRLHAAH